MNNYFKNKFIFGHLGKYSIKNKEENTTNHILYMLNRLQQMFKHINKGEYIETLNFEFLEGVLMSKGHVILAKHEGKFYFFTGGWGGEPDEYYIPKFYTVANPYLGFSKTFEIGVDCVLFKNDTYAVGLIPILEKYGYLLSESELSILLATINLRATSIITATNDTAKKSAQEFLKQMEEGNVGIIADREWKEEDGIKVQPIFNSGAANYITQLIENHQYILSNEYKELGLQSNYNMKRESLNENEIGMDSELLLPLVENMLECRRRSWEQVREIFGLDFEVELASSWGNRIREIEREEEFEDLEIEEKEVEIEEKEVEIENTEESEETEDTEESEETVDTEESEETGDIKEGDEDEEEKDEND